MKVCQLETGSRLYNDALKLRYELFFQQHGLPVDIVADAYEKESRHIAVVEGNSLIAYGRFSILSEDVCQLSQIVVKPEQQRKGYGTMVLKELIGLARRRGMKKIILNARTTATVLYEKLGFKRDGEIFPSMRTGTPHVQMYLTISHT
jgi:predicted GNAT family N-acyltransferase